MAASQSVLEILIQAVDESAAALQGAQNNLKEVAQSAISTGVEVGIAGAALTAAYGGVVASAAGVQESQDSLRQAITDAMAGAGTSTDAYKTQVQFLKDKIDGYKASIQSATATLDTHTGSVEKSAAAHAKAAASIATAQINIQKYQEQLDILTNSQDLNGQSVDDITTKLESQADGNVSLGFSVADSTKSLMQAFTATKSVSEAMQVNSAAMDLARAKNIDLGTATNQVILAMNGQGRALATYGIQIKDGLSGMEALTAVQGAVNGQAEAYAGTLSGSLAVAMQSFNKLISDMGSTQLPILAQLLGWLVKIIDAVDQFTQKHQKLTETILIFVGVLGVLLTLLGSLLVIFGTITLVVLALTAPFAGLIVLFAVLAAVIIANWQNLADDMTAIWKVVESFFTTAWAWMKNIFSTSLKFIQTEWNQVWTDMSAFLSNIWDTIKTTVKTGVNDVISAINAFINALDAIHISLPSISIPGTKLATPAVNLGFNIPDIPMLAAGGFVTSPTLALIGEAGPEAVMPLSSLGGGAPGGAATQIVVNINGGIFPADQSAIKQIGDMLAKTIVAQIRTRNYAV
jgi:hypothetical protein